MNTRARNAQRAASSGGFSRQLAARRRTTAPARRSVPRPPVHFGRRALQKSTTAGTLERLAGLLPASGAKTKGRGTGGGRKGTAGLALLAGAAGLAFKNREKLTALLARKRSGEERVEPSTTSASASGSPVPP